MGSSALLGSGPSFRQVALPRDSGKVAVKAWCRGVAVKAAAAEQMVSPAAQRLPHGRVHNFSAGPAVLPLPVLEQAQADLINWQGSGASVMEMSHRSKEFTSIIEQAEADLRTLLGIPGNYKVLFLQGGATAQFAAVPLNLTQPGDKVDYIVTGSWSKKAAQEAEKYANIRIAAKGDCHKRPQTIGQAAVMYGACPSLLFHLLVRRKR